MTPEVECLLLGLSPATREAIPEPELRDRLDEALVRFQTTRRFTSDQWSAAVELWNDALPTERQLRHAYCARTGKHDWVGLPMAGARVCRRCITYRLGEP